MGKRKREEKRKAKDNKKRKNKQRDQQRKFDSQKSYRSLHISSGSQIIIPRDKVSYEVYVSPDNYTEKTADDMKVGDFIRPVKVIQEVRDSELESLIVDRIPIAANAKNRFYVTLEGGFKVPALMYHILKSYNSPVGARPYLGLNNLEKAISENDIPKDKLRRIAEDLQDRSKEYAKQNGLDQYVSPFYGWLGVDKEGNGKEIRSTLIPRKAGFAYLRFLEQEISPELKQFADAFLDNEDNETKRFYRYITGLRSKLTKFRNKFSSLDLSDLVTVENWDIFDSADRVVVDVEFDEGVRGKIKMKRGPLQKKVLEYFEGFDFTPEIIEITNYLDSLKTQEVLVRIEKIQNITPEQKDKRDIYTINAGELRPARKERKDCDNLAIADILELNELMNGMIDEVVINYSLRNGITLDTFNTPFIGKMLSNYFGVRNKNYDFVVYCLQKELLPWSGLVKDVSEQIRGAVFSGQLDNDFSLASGTFQRLLETNARVKNAHSDKFWEFIFCRSLRKSLNSPFIASEIFQDKAYKKYNDFEFFEQEPKLKKRIEDMGYTNHPRSRLLSYYVLHIPTLLKGEEDYSNKPILSMNINGMDTPIVQNAMGGTDISGETPIMMFPQNYLYHDLVRKVKPYLEYFASRTELEVQGLELNIPMDLSNPNADMSAALNVMADQLINKKRGAMDSEHYDKERHVFNLMEDVQLLNDYAMLIRQADQTIMTKGNLDIILEKHNLSECIGLLHPNNFILE